LWQADSRRILAAMLERILSSANFAPATALIALR
jgi:hypothetical protein